MGKRTLAMVVYDPAATAAASSSSQSEQRDSKRAPPSADAGAVVPYEYDDVEALDAVPLNAIAPRRLRLAPVAAIPEEPPFLRTHILPALGLLKGLPVHFIDRKRVTGTDLDAHQNRFRVPSDGVLHRLRPMLTPDELDSANLLHDPAPRPRKQQPGPEPQPEHVVAADNETEHQEQGKMKRKKMQGRSHGGLPVKLVDLAAGPSGELLLSRWESSSGTIIKGEGYMDFVRRCSFKQDDVVEIWAFKQRAFRLFGAAVCDESHLHLLIIVKRDEEDGAHAQHGSSCAATAPAGTE